MQTTPGRNALRRNKELVRNTHRSFIIRRQIAVAPDCSSYNRVGLTPRVSSAYERDYDFIDSRSAASTVSNSERKPNETS
jgi:hypothetical protein